MIKIRISLDNTIFFSVAFLFCRDSSRQLAHFSVSNYWTPCRWRLAWLRCLLKKPLPYSQLHASTIEGMKCLCWFIFIFWSSRHLCVVTSFSYIWKWPCYNLCFNFILIIWSVPGFDCEWVSPLWKLGALRLLFA